MKYKVGLVIMPSWGTTDIPLALSTLVSYLRENNVSAKAFDFNIQLYNLLSEQRKWWDLAEGLDAWQRKPFVDQFFKDHLPLIEDLLADVMDGEPEFVGFTVLCSNRLFTELVAEHLKKTYPDVKILFGGPDLAHLQNLPAYAEAHSYVTHFVNGEGEEALLKIVQGKEDPEKRVINVWNRGASLDYLPLQDFSDFDFRLYKDPYAFPIYSSRGCPNACIYCTEVTFIPFRFRTAARLFADIKKQKETYPFLRMFRLHESISNGIVRELEAFADLMIEADLGLKFAINGAVIRKEMTPQVLQKLAKAGCIQINFGLETPSHEVLSNIGKKLAKGTDIDKMIKDVDESGINASLNIMFGLPGETEKDFAMQMEFLERNREHISIIAPSMWFTYFPENSNGFKNPVRHGIDTTWGPMYWRTVSGDNDYLIRMDRFIRYTDFMAKLGVPNVFGYPVLANRDQLVGEYFDDLVRQGHMTREKAEEMKKVSRPRQSAGKTVTRGRLAPLKDFVRALLVKLAPLTVPDGASEAARSRRLEGELNALVAAQTPRTVDAPARVPVEA